LEKLLQQQQDQQQNPDQNQDQNQDQQQDQDKKQQNQATEQWLRQIQDDPGGLLRRKFQRDYQLRLQGRK